MQYIILACLTWPREAKENLSQDDRSWARTLGLPNAESTLYQLNYGFSGFSTFFKKDMYSAVVGVSAIQFKFGHTCII